jgi:hypothetical protein
VIEAKFAMAGGGSKPGELVSKDKEAADVSTQGDEKGEESIRIQNHECTHEIEALEQQWLSCPARIKKSQKNHKNLSLRGMEIPRTPWKEVSWRQQSSCLIAEMRLQVRRPIWIVAKGKAHAKNNLLKEERWRRKPYRIGHPTGIT